MVKNPLITLTTDFGQRDPFVGIMKGVMLGINPSLQFIDLTHEIESQNILQAVYLLDSACRYFPGGTIHLIVVDPGVGSERKALLVKTRKYYFVAPDNGVLSALLKKEEDVEVYRLDPERFVAGKISTTFHGRDVFAPAAALISSGQETAKLGDKIESFVKIDIPQPAKIDEQRFSGEIIYIDKFGNVTTNFTEQFLSENFDDMPVLIKTGSHQVTELKTNYSEAKPGELSALINSWSKIEIFLPSGNAGGLLKVKVGEKVEIKASD